MACHVVGFSSLQVIAPLLPPGPRVVHGAAMTSPESESEGLEPSPEPSETPEPAAPAVVEEKPRRPRVPIASESFAEAARGLALWVLIGFALLVWARFAFGKAWLGEYLGHNRLPMRDRVVFIIQIFAAGGLAGSLSAAYLFVRRNVPGTTREFERWAWFLSPLILCPVVPLVRETDIWFGNHNALLPIVLFGAMLAELFVYQSIRHVPAVVSSMWLGSASELSTWTARPRVRWARSHAFLAIVLVAAVAYGLFMSFYTVRWHHRLGTAIFDLGINNNLFAGGLHGKFNHSPIVFPDDPAKYWANHVKLGLYLFLPIYALIPKPETLLVIQSISLGLGAIPLFLFGRRHIQEWAACVIALCYLAYYPMHGANFYEMKEPPTAAVFVLTTIWAMDAKRFKTGWVFFFVSMIMREDMPIPLAVIGVFFVLSGYRPRTGLVMTAIASIWFVFLRFKVMTDAGSWWFPNMYKDLYSEPDTGFRSVLKTLISNPAFVLKHIFVEKKFWYLMHLLVPVVFLPARRWYLWAAFVPGAILTLLITNYDPPLMFSFQYVMYWGPYLFVAAILAVRAIVAEHPFGGPKGAAAVAAVAFASFALTYNYGAFPRRDLALQSGYHKIKFGWSAEEEKTYQDVLALVASVPKDASVAATERVGAHLSGRVDFFTLRRGTHGAEYVVARKSELRLDKTRDHVRDALSDGRYGLLRRFGEFAVLKKGASTKGNASLIEEWELGKKPRVKPKKPKHNEKPDEGGGPEGSPEEEPEEGGQP